MTDPKQTKDSFESTYLVIGLLMSCIFLVYSSVLTARLIIEEYNQRTIVFRQVIISKNVTNQDSFLQILLVAIVTLVATLFIFKKKVHELY